MDEEESVREAARSVLNKFGYTAITAGNGREGIEAFRQHHTDIVAVILDSTMKDMSGGEVFSRMTLISPNVSVILSSGYSENDAVNRFGEAGPAGFLQKPYLPKALIAKLHEALAK